MHKYPKTSKGFDLLFVLFAFWLTLGGFVDGWAHNHLASLETFFTPWHAIFYSGFTALAVLLIYQAIENYEAGFRWPRLLPREYHLSLIGVFIFFFAGIGDMLWHIFFGIEVSVDALLSPTHLLLALGVVIMVSAPMHALWHRNSDEKPPTLAILFSTVFFLSMITFMTQFVHPLHHPWMDKNLITNPGNLGQALGVASVIVQTGIFMGLALTIIKKWRPPMGSFMFILGLNAVFMSILKDQYRFIPAFLIAGLIVDMLYRLLQPRASTPRAFRIFATLTPIIIYSAYTITIFLTSGTWWSIHLWAGTIAMAGIIGFLLSYLVVEPAQGEN